MGSCSNTMLGVFLEDVPRAGRTWLGAKPGSCSREVGRPCSHIARSPGFHYFDENQTVLFLSFFSFHEIAVK